MCSIGEMRRSQERLSELEKLGGRILTLPSIWKISTHFYLHFRGIKSYKDVRWVLRLRSAHALVTRP
jgi:hypothetical protein